MATTPQTVPAPIALVDERRSRFTLRHLSFFFVCIALITSGYLSSTYLFNTEAVCLETSFISCETTRASVWARFNGIPVAYLGFITYATIFTLLVLEKRVPILREYGVVILFAIMLFGFAYHCYLTYNSIVFLRVICPWCVATHVAMTGLLIITGIRLWRTFNTPRLAS